MSDYFRKWKPEAAKKALLAELASNADIAGKFVEDDARKRLYAITDPEWGEKYRRLIVGRLLTHIVEQESEAITIWVGVRPGPKGSHHGFWIEVGTRSRRGKPGHPAHPFLRPAVFQNGRKILALLAGK